MNLRKVIVLFAVVSSLGAFAGGCQSGGVGDPCTPEDEYQQSFSGFSPSEVNIESRSFQCETRVCLVNHFRGRVTCPLGQDEATADAAARYSACKARNFTGEGCSPVTYKSATSNGEFKAGDEYKPTHGNGCRVPGSSGNTPDVINVSVLPQCQGRQAKDTVYCSCRCDGPDKDAKYCECPGGFTCKKFEEFDLGAAVSQGSANLRGSYCVKDDSALDFKPTECVQSDTYAKADDSCADNPAKCGLADGANP